jgi:hypothetical protein
MANTNTITALYNLGAQTVNASTATLLTQTVNGVTSTAVLSMPPNANVDGHAFRLRLIGKATGNANTLAFNIYSGTTTGTPLAAFTAGTGVATTGANFAVETTLSWDSVSGLLNGVVGGQINRVLTAAATTSAVSGITSTAGLQFVAAATFSSASTNNTVSVEEFSIEQI